MSKKIWIIANPPDVLTEDTAYLIGRIAGRFETFYVSQIAFESGTAPRPPANVDLIVNRHRGKNPDFLRSLGQVAEELDVYVTNPTVAAGRAEDKRFLLEDFGDLIPDTIVVSNREEFLDAFDRFDQDVVIKEPFTFGGRMVRRVSSVSEVQTFDDLLKQARYGEIIVQPFLSGFAKGDRRIVLVKGDDGKPKPISYFTRHPAPGQWICNISQGGSCVVERPSDYELSLAVAVAERSGLDYVGLDFGWHMDRLYLIELNQTGGGMIDFDIGHRANCADKVAKFIERCAYDVA